jgi:hypothetical protein
MNKQPLNGTPTYALQKLVEAMHSMATGPGDVRERLHSASLSITFLKEDDFPEHLQADWSWVYHQLTKYGPAYDYAGKIIRGSVEETMRRIKRATGVKIAERLVRIYHELDAYVNPR